MPDYARRWCRRCEEVTEHWRDGSPGIRDPRFVLVALVVALAWIFVEPWHCRTCGGSNWPWSRWFRRT